MHVIKHVCIWLFVWMILATGMPGFGGTIEELRTKSYEGDCEARYQLAILLEKGEGIKKDMSEAINLLDWAALEGHEKAKNKLELLINDIEANSLKNDAYSQFLLGACLFYGEGKDANEREGIEWLLKSSKNGNSEAQYYLGEIFLGKRPVGRPKDKKIVDPVKGIEWLKKSAELGNVSALASLFQIYIDGEHVNKNYAEAFKLAEEGLKLNNAEAVMSLGAMYFLGIGVKSDKSKALYYWHKSADMGYEGAKKFLGSKYNPKIWEGENYSPSGWHAYQFTPLIPLPHVITIDIGSRNPEQAVKWLKEAVKMQDAYGYSDEDCENALGNAYFLGEGVERDYQEAIKWWEKAAIKRPGILIGNTDALYHLGMAYKNGHGVNRDMEKAIQYFEMSAKFNQKNSQRELLVIYDQQIKSPKDFLAKAKSVEIWDKIIWEFLEKKSKKFTKVKDVGFSLGEVFDHLAETNRSIDDVSKSIHLAEKIEEEMDVFRLALNQLQKKEAVDKISSTTFPAKLALLIANSNYSKFGGLANTDSDAQKLAKVLNSLGFQVSILKNASKEQMLDALKDFEAKVRGTNAIAFFHYGGHGVQVEGKNYLIPADAEIPDERRVSTRAVDLDEVIAVLDSAKPKASVLVVDACRHNPLPATATRSATRGLAVVGRKPKNSVIIYAAEAGNEAFDGLFTPILAENLQEHSDKSLNQIMQKVRAEVFERSKGAQTPGEYNQLFEDLFFSKN